MTRLFGVTLDKSHIVTLNRADGMGNPPEWYTHCSCGWSGISVDSVDVIDYYGEDRVDPRVKAVSKKFGREQLTIGNRVRGNEDTALIQILNHLNYEPLEDLAVSEREFNRAVEDVKLLTIDDSREVVREKTETLNNAVDNLNDAKNRIRVWSTIKVPQLTVPNSEAQQELRVISLELALGALQNGRISEGHYDQIKNDTNGRFWG